MAITDPRAAHSDPHGPDGLREDEDHKKRLDRELMELLNELRVALPGIQVLFAFLLTVPFSQRFTELTGFQRDTYFAAFLSTAIATALMLAPTAHHRLRWRRYDKERLLRGANALAIAGLAVLVFATGSSILLIADLLFGLRWAGLVAGVLVGGYVWLWFGVPAVRALRDRDSLGPGR